MSSSKKYFGSKSRRLRDTQEFLEKVKLRDETDVILAKCLSKKKEIEQQRNQIATLFIKSNEKEAALKSHISSINSKIYDTSIEIDSHIERLSKEILDMIAEIQIKIKKALEYTKLEMEKEIEEKFNEAEKKQQEKMNEKIKEQNEIIQKVNNSRYQLDLVKIKFEETNIQCEKLCKVNDKLKIDLDTVKSDNENLQKKLDEVTKENKKIQEEYHQYYSIGKSKEMNNENNNMNNKENSESKNSEDDSENDDFPQKTISVLKEDKKDEYNPKNLIKILKESIKLIHRESAELYQKCSDEKKQKNEASQLLQKCIDDINIEIHNITQGIPKPSRYETLFGNSESIQSSIKSDKKKYLDKKLEILTYIFDNALQNVKYKRMFIGNPNMSQRATFYK